MGPVLCIENVSDLCDALIILFIDISLLAIADICRVIMIKLALLPDYNNNTPKYAGHIVHKLHSHKIIQNIGRVQQ